MNRLAWIVVLLLILGSWVALGKLRGSNKDLVPFAGRWIGGFEPEENRQNGLDGHLQVYLSGKKFKLHLSGPQQSVELDGTWTKEGDRRIVLRPASIQIDDGGGAEMRDPNKPFIPSDDIRSALTREIPLDLSSDGKALTGLTTSMGELAGKHEFGR
jgi:hypothetical protein